MRRSTASRQGARAVQTAVDLAGATTTCFKGWSSGGAAQIVPAPLGLTASAVGGVGGATSYLADTELLKNADAYNVGQNLQSGADMASKVVLAVDLFASGPDAYLQDARTAWSSIGGVADCVEPALDKVAAGGKG